MSRSAARPPRSPDEWLADAERLRPIIEERRLARIDEVLERRTRHLCLVAEDTYDPHNIAALVRTCDALGVQAVHAVHEAHPEGTFQPSPKVAVGASRWLDVYTWSGTDACVDQLEAEGYRVAVADVDAERSLEEVDWSQPTAILVGNEREGPSERARARAAVRFRIPMLGFVDSFNVSVATALCLYRARCALAAARGSWRGDLDEATKDELRARWTVESVPRAETILAALRRREDGAAATPATPSG